MSTTTLASPRQIEFLQRLRAERGLAPLSADETASLTGGRSGSASERIDALLATPATGTREVLVSDPGVYETNGTIYIVKPNKAKTNLYAKRIVEIGGTRTTDAGIFVAVEFEYDRGAIFEIRPEHRITGPRAKELTLRYGKCICCGRDLKAGESVEQGIGPVCVKSFPDLLAERAEIKARARAEAKASRSLVAAGPVAVAESDPEVSIEATPERRAKIAENYEAARAVRESEDFNARWVEHKNEFVRLEAEQETAAEMEEERALGVGPAAERDGTEIGEEPEFVADEPLGLVALARAIESKPEPPTFPTDFPGASQVDADAARAARLIRGAFDALRAEVGGPQVDADEAFVLQTLRTLIGGYER